MTTIATPRATAGALWRFSRPHTIIGTTLSVLGIFAISAHEHHVANPVLQVVCTLIAGLAVNVFIVGINQLQDVAVDRVNKPRLPLASGELTLAQGKVIVATCAVLPLVMAVTQGVAETVAVGAALAIGWAYSCPPLHLKRFPVAASASISIVRSLVVNLGVALHFSDRVPDAVWALTLFVIPFSFAIAVLKDVPDAAGDSQFDIRTFTVRLGGRAAFRIGMAALTLAYLGMAIGGPLALDGGGVLIAAHLAVLALLSRWAAPHRSRRPGRLHRLLHARVGAVLLRVPHRARRRNTVLAMKGLMVVGLAHGAGEGSVAAGCAAVLKRAGTAAHAKKILEYDLTASPIIAARHEGDTINPSAVIADIRTDDADAALVVAAPGGLMATLTHSATLRDLVGDLHWPVVLAARANPEATNLVRLSLAAARSARLTVAAVVLTNWPEEPDTIQNDERKLLGQVAGCTVLTLAESPSARGADVEYWPVGEWLDAIPPEPEPAPVRPTAPRVSSVAIPTPAAPPPPSSGELGLEAFAGWDPRPTGDPRHTPRPRMMEALLEIAAAEGPLRASRAYTLYNRASGGKKLTGAARQPLVSALRWLGQEDKVVLVEQGDDLIVRTPDQPEVRLRDLGDRTLEEVPLDEIAELMRRLGRASDLKRAVLNTYGLVRLTQRADDYLNLAIGLL